MFCNVRRLWLFHMLKNISVPRSFENKAFPLIPIYMKGSRCIQMPKVFWLAYEIFLWLSCYLQCPQTITQHTFTGTSKRLTQEMEVFSYSLHRDSWVTISQPYIVFFFYHLFVFLSWMLCCNQYLGLVLSGFVYFCSLPRGKLHFWACWGSCFILIHTLPLSNIQIVECSF